MRLYNRLPGETTRTRSAARSAAGALSLIFDGFLSHIADASSRRQKKQARKLVPQETHLNPAYAAGHHHVATATRYARNKFNPPEKDVLLLGVPWRRSHFTAGYPTKDETVDLLSATQAASRDALIL